MSDHGQRVPAPPHSVACSVVTVTRPVRAITVVRLEVRSGGPFRFRAGQYARVRFPDWPARAYSLANRPDQPVLELHIRDSIGRDSVGRDGAGHVSPFEPLAPGDRATVEGPFGDAWLREDHAGPMLAIAGGSGIAAVKSIVETALEGGMGQDIHAYFGVRAEADLYLEDHFLGLARAHGNFRFTPVLSDPEGATARRTGLVSDAAAADFDRLEGWKAYVAGPPPMVEATVRRLTARGLDPAEIHGDAHDPKAK